MTRALRLLVYGTILAAGFVLLISTAYPLLVQAVVLVVMASIGTLALYQPHAGVTRVVAVVVALALLVAALSAAGLVLVGVPVVVLFLLLVAVTGRAGRRSTAVSEMTDER